MKCAVRVFCEVRFRRWSLGVVRGGGARSWVKKRRCWSAVGGGGWRRKRRRIGGGERVVRWERGERGRL